MITNCFLTGFYPSYSVIVGGVSYESVDEISLLSESDRYFVCLSLSAGLNTLPQDFDASSFSSVSIRFSQGQSPTILLQFEVDPITYSIIQSKLSNYHLGRQRV